MGTHKCCFTEISTKQLPAEWATSIISHIHVFNYSVEGLAQTKHSPVLHYREKPHHTQLKCNEIHTKYHHCLVFFSSVIMDLKRGVIDPTRCLFTRLESQLQLCTNSVLLYYVMLCISP